MNRILIIGTKNPLFSEILVDKTDLDNFYKVFKGSIKLSYISTLKILKENNIECGFIDPVDIDQKIEEYKPTHVVINGVWISPNELKTYTEKYKNINWIVLNHGEIASTAVDHNLIDWLIEYLHMEKVSIASVSLRTFNDLNIIADSLALENFSKNKVKLLPTLHDLNFEKVKPKQKETDVIDIACFGVIRFLKNQLIQAIAAIEYAKRKKVKLRYHININPTWERISGEHIEGFNQILRNIRGLFSSLDKDKFELIEHRWSSREVFINLVKKMDLGLNLSLSESFGLICTDFVFNNIPVIGSKEIFWLPEECIADNTDTENIVTTMINVMDNYESNEIYEKTIKKLAVWNVQALDNWKSL